jgi:peptide/nickel transport system permease protein
LIGFVVRRLLSLIPVALVVGTSVFALVHLIPGDPATVMLGAGASAEEARRLQAALRLDQPLPVQYAVWLGRTALGDLGVSIVQQRPVIAVIADRLEPTLVLAVAATLLGLVVGVPLGIAAATNAGKPADRVIMIVAVAGISIPYFWLGLLAILIFAVELRWLPATGYTSPFIEGWGSLRYLILPVTALGFSQAGFVARLSRTTSLQVLQENYIRTARAKGLPNRRVLRVHTLRNVLIPVITVAGLSFGILLGGAVVTETVFGIPGMGRLILDAIKQRDYPVIQGALLLIAMFNVLVNLVVDLAYVIVDPRITYS